MCVKGVEVGGEGRMAKNTETKGRIRAWNLQFRDHLVTSDKADITSATIIRLEEDEVFPHD